MVKKLTIELEDIERNDFLWLRYHHHQHRHSHHFYNKRKEEKKEENESEFLVRSIDFLSSHTQNLTALTRN